MLQADPASGQSLEARRRIVGPPLLRLVTVTAALLLVSALVVTGSRSAFSDTTSNTGNNWAAGTVVITDDDSGTAMFSVSDMAPGESVTKCIEVTYSGSLTPATVSLYGSTGGTGLDAYLDLDVDLGAGGTFSDCSGFTKDAGGDIFTGTMSGFAGTHTNFATGLQSWSPASTPVSKTYRFALTLQDNNSAQGLDATGTFTWEAQNQ